MKYRLPESLRIANLSSTLRHIFVSVSRMRLSQKLIINKLTGTDNEKSSTSFIGNLNYSLGKMRLRIPVGSSQCNVRTLHRSVCICMWLFNFVSCLWARTDLWDTINQTKFIGFCDATVALLIHSLSLIGEYIKPESSLNPQMCY